MGGWVGGWSTFVEERIALLTRSEAVSCRRRNDQSGQEDGGSLHLFFLGGEGLGLAVRGGWVGGMRCWTL